MKSVEFTWTLSSGWANLPNAEFAPDLILFFGSRPVLSDSSHFEFLKDRFPQAIVLGTSGGGQIHSSGIIDDGITGLALKFDDASIRLAKSVVNSNGVSFDAGRMLGTSLRADDLAGVFILSEGLKINGDQLIEGLSSCLPSNIVVCGGMAGDDGQFERTILYANAQPMRGVVAAIGFYGPNVRLNFGHGGGWCAIGEEMNISLSRNNDLYDLNGRSALEVYDAHLGEAAKQLPLSGLRFPLSIHDADGNDAPMVRTLLSIDREVGIMTFAGNVPENWKARLMSASSNDLISAAAQAAVMSASKPRKNIAHKEYASASILISCIGRRLVLEADSKLEVAAIREKLDVGTAMAGFYSFGEFCTPALGSQARLYNQSMVVFSISEDSPNSHAASA